MIANASSSRAALPEERGRRADAAEVAAPERDPAAASLGQVQRGEVVPHVPQLGVERVVDQPAHHLDRRSLRADHVAADHPLDDVEVPDAPDDDALVPLDQLLGELVEVLVLASARVDLDQRQARRSCAAWNASPSGFATRRSSGSPASRSRCRGRAPCAPPGTPTATGARACRAPTVTSLKQSFARRSSRIAPPRSPVADQPRRLLDLVPRRA